MSCVARRMRWAHSEEGADTFQMQPLDGGATPGSERDALEVRSRIPITGR